MNAFLNWLSESSIAHFFAITRSLERQNKELKETIVSLKSENRELLDKLFLVMGLAQVNTVPVYSNELENINTGPVLPSSLTAEAEQEDWLMWQEEEKRRLTEAAENYKFMHS